MITITTRDITARLSETGVESAVTTDREGNETVVIRRDDESRICAGAATEGIDCAAYSGDDEILGQNWFPTIETFVTFAAEWQH